MRKRILIVLSVLLVLGLFAAVYAYRIDNASDAKMSCCAKADCDKDSSCCGMADCCKDGKCSMGGACCKDKDSCPMKQTGESKTTNDMDTSKINFVSGDDCCNKGADCCKGGGACCHKKS